MPAAKWMPEPRGWTVAQVAGRMGMSLSKFHRVREALLKEGMSRPDQTTGKTDAKALEAWMDRRSGLGSVANDAEGQVLKAIRGKRAS